MRELIVSAHPGGAFVMVPGNAQCLDRPVFSPIIQKLSEVGAVALCSW